MVDFLEAHRHRLGYGSAHVRDAEENAMTDTRVSTGVPAQRSAAEAAVDAYLAAWNAHDGAAVAAIVAVSYVDPTLPAPISGTELAANVDALCAAFPDLRFDHVASHVAGTTVVVEWRMVGTNNGAPLPGAPAPTNGTIDLPGIDVITTADAAIQTVTGYFDQKSFVEQLGLQTFVMPQDEWPVSFGTSTRVDLGNTTLPGAFTMTWIELAASEFGELTERTREIVTALASEPGFIGFTSASVGGRNYTFTAWTSPEAAEASLARTSAHNQAMARVYSEGFGGRGWTSMWQPHRLNKQFARCDGCARYVEFAHGATTATCECGAEMTAVPYL